jgi:transketolase
MAIAGKYLDKLDYRIYSLCGDSELAEGSVWEALDKASFYHLDNLTVIVDVNRLGQRGPTELEWDMEAYKKRVEAFGCKGIILDGHDFNAIDDAFQVALATESQPTVLLAKTIKGKGVPEIEDQNGWHGTALPKEMAEKAIAYIDPPKEKIFPETKKPIPAEANIIHGKTTATLPKYEKGTPVATRKAFGDGLAALAGTADVVVFDAEVGNSTHADAFKKVAPERYFEAFIAEQLMVAAAGGAATRGYKAFAGTFAAFLSRAYDFVRMLGISEVPLRLSGSHCGVEIGADGPSQMALEDLASIRAIHGSTVLYPSDAVSAAALTVQMADLGGISYIRTTRGAYPVLYDNDETFPIGGSKVLRHSDADQVSLIGAGITLHQSLKAAEILSESNISVRVIDLYSVKPLDESTLLESVKATNGKVVITEDHYKEGGIGEAVTASLAGKGVDLEIRHLAVSSLSCSGTTEELLHHAHISADDIVAAVKSLL